MAEPVRGQAETAGPPRVVAFGGGHGLAAALGAWRRITPELTAVVTVADDGGSSGRIRREMPVLPPGDLRMALAALTGEDERGREAVTAPEGDHPGRSASTGCAAHYSRPRSR